MRTRSQAVASASWMATAAAAAPAATANTREPAVSLAAFFREDALVGLDCGRDDAVMVGDAAFTSYEGQRRPECPLGGGRFATYDAPGALPSPTRLQLHFPRVHRPIDGSRFPMGKKRARQRQHQKDLRAMQVRSADDALLFVRSMRRTGSAAGTVVAVFTGAGGRFVDLYNVPDGGEPLTGLVEMMCTIQSRAQHRPRALFLVTDRTGEVPADRPDDEATWSELVAIAAEHDMQLLDWFVAWESKAFSVAEFAEIPAGWTRPSRIIEATQAAREEAVVDREAWLERHEEALLGQSLVVVGGFVPVGDPGFNLREDGFALAAEQREFGPRRLVVHCSDAVGVPVAIGHCLRTDPPEEALGPCLQHVGEGAVAAVAYCDEPVGWGPPPDDLAERFARARSVAAEHGIHLVDWFACDDDNVRSSRAALYPGDEWWDIPQ